VAKQAIYTTGGTVQAGGGIYLSRQTDEELLTLCRAGTLSYILTPRQMGKSSLMVWTAEQLSQEGVRSVIIDLTQLGVQVTAEQWYLGLLTIIEEQLELETDVVQWWQERTHLGSTQRLTQFFKDVLLVEVAERVTIFVDEIDSTLSLDFTDDLFAAIRYLFVARAQEPEFHRLSFVLIGVATPGDLIRDPKRTPFNVGQRVDLTDFSLEEALPLSAGLEVAAAQAEQVMGWVLKWTGGHPYLTQRLCQAMTQVGGRRWSEAEVDRLVVSTFLGQQSEQDNNLQFVRDMLTKRAPEPGLVLKTYREIWRGKRLVMDEEQSLVKSHLKLSGVVRREGRALHIRNRIYRQVFDGRWIQTHLPENWWQRLKPAMPIIATLLMALIVMTGLVIYANQQRQIAIDALHQREKAEQQTMIVGKQRQEAIKQSQLLEGLLRRSSIATPTLRPKLKAFLDMIAWSLGTAQPNGYSLIFSGDSFANFKDHPRQLKCAIYLGKKICSDTAGRYSLVSSTWDDLVQKLQLPDFSPPSQDQAAIELIREQNALEDLETGKLESAIYKASQVWGSLPNSNGVSNYGFQVPSINTLRSVYEIYYLKSLYPIGKSLRVK